MTKRSRGGFITEYIGASRAPVVVIDSFIDEPQALVEHAAQRSDFAVRSRFYPGIRAPAPASYVEAIGPLLEGAIRAAFGAQGDIEIIESNLSLVTTPAPRLVPFQRIPHIDGTERNILAVLHYLCSPEHGGTSFYRHRRTGYERLTEQNVEEYMRSVDSEVREFGMPESRFVDGDTPFFERIARFDAAFNRALVYSGAILHSGNIPANFVPDPNPRTGRLTVNTFLKLHPGAASASPPHG